MAYSQLTIINEEAQDISSLHGETVTIHSFKKESLNWGGMTIELDAFSLLDDPSVKCIPKIKFYNEIVKDFEIHFKDAAVSPTNLYEISLYLILESNKLQHVQTLNARPVSPQVILMFPDIAPLSIAPPCYRTNSNSSPFVITGSLIFLTKIRRKDIPYIFEKKPEVLLPGQITDCSLLFENETLSNFTIFIKDREFRVHKEILAAKSPVFLSMFHQEMKEKKENLVTIEDIEADVFREMLRYIYTNNVHDLNVHAEKLFQAADKYDILKLKSFCADELTKSLKIENALHILDLADRHNESTLKERTIKFIGNNMKSMLETKEYNTWSVSAPPHLYASILRTVTLKEFF